MQPRCGHCVGCWRGYPGASNRRAPCPPAAHHLLGSAAQLTSWPSRCGLLSYLSASASLESFPQLSCLHGPHSATGIFFILQGLVHKLTTVGSQPDCLVGSILHPSEPVTLQALCASLGTQVPLNHGLLVGQFSHQNISL